MYKPDLIERELPNSTIRYTAPLATTSAKNLENSWKSHIAAGNEYYARANYSDAFETYHGAFDLASQLIRREVDCRSEGIPTTPIYLITCANVGNAAIKLGRLNEADDWFMRALRLASLKADFSGKYSLEALTRQTVDVKMAMWNYADFCERTTRSVDRDRVQDALHAGAEVCSGAFQIESILSPL